jgi:hypothetical protein
MYPKKIKRFHLSHTSVRSNNLHVLELNMVCSCPHMCGRLNLRHGTKCSTNNPAVNCPLALPDAGMNRGPIANNPQFVPKDCGLLASGARFIPASGKASGQFTAGLFVEHLVPCLKFNRPHMWGHEHTMYPKFHLQRKQNTIKANTSTLRRDSLQRACMYIFRYSL